MLLFAFMVDWGWIVIVVPIDKETCVHGGCDIDASKTDRNCVGRRPSYRESGLVWFGLSELFGYRKQRFLREFEFR